MPVSSVPDFFFFFGLGAMKPCRNFLITQAWMVMTTSPKSFRLFMSFSCEEDGEEEEEEREETDWAMEMKEEEGNEEVEKKCIWGFLADMRLKCNFINYKSWN